MRARNLIAAVVCVCVGVFVFAGSAMAAETPEVLKPEQVSAHKATLRGILNPNAPGEVGVNYRFRVAKSATECESLNFEEFGESTSLGDEKELVTADASGLNAATTYTFCLEFYSPIEERRINSPPETFTTPVSEPLVEAETGASINSSEVMLEAQVSPGGLPTSVRVEYGPTASYGSGTTDREIAGSNVSVSEQVRLQGLTPSSQYHYRFVASNSQGTSDGVDMTFTTPQALVTSALGLPDGRSYELVSSREDVETYVPNYKEELPEGTASETFGETGQYRASVDGKTVTYGGDPPASGVGGTGETGPGYGNQYLSTRNATGWKSDDIESGVTAENVVRFDAFSDDLSLTTIVTKPSAVPSPTPAPPATCKSRTAYVRDAEGFHALVTESQEPARCEAVASAGISADDTHVLLSSPEALTPQAISGAENVYHYIGNLYDSVRGRLYQVNVLPGGEPEQHPNATFGGVAPDPEGDYENNFLGDVSSDGSRVFWTDLNTEVTSEDPAGTTRLFVRENDTRPESSLDPDGECTNPLDACTVQLDAKQGGAGQGGGGVFAASSSDGSLVLFTDGSQLTADSKATAERPDLYQYDLETGVLSDLTPVSTGVSADVLGVIGASEDGSYAYFVAKGKLVSTPNRENKEPVTEQPNLYLVHQGVTTFIGTLEQGDDTYHSSGGSCSCSTSGDWYYDPSERDAQVSANGQAIGFMSHAKLTEYDNYGLYGYNFATPEYRNLPEVFVYEVGTARISCVSCNPDGAPPVPSSVPSEKRDTWENQFNSYVALSGEVAGTEGGADFMPRWINSSGRQVYFMSNQPLVASDTNRYQDVYEWESDGSGGCGQGAGCIAPISSVTTPGAAYFVDASASGEDVFFTQRANLVPGAADENVKLYDARVGGGFPESSIACVGTGCQGVPPAPPIFATPSSVTFAGVGDFETSSQTGRVTSKRSAGGNAKKLSKALRACRKRSRRARAGCERKARKRYPRTAKRGKR
ncbi:MAG: fibronectin type III domain-containing protein [Solirubrobacteraceae bacterium]